MAIPVYLWLKDDIGNRIKGSVEVAHREGSIEITSLAHSVFLPTDDLTGNITATREHVPFILTKEVDASSPYLYQFVTTGRRLKSAELKFYRINYAGQEEEYFNVLLEGARIICMTPFMENVKAPDYEHRGHIEIIEIMYEKVTWKYLDGNIIHSDSWKERSAA